MIVVVVAVMIGLGTFRGFSLFLALFGLLFGCIVVAAGALAQITLVMLFRSRTLPQ